MQLSSSVRKKYFVKQNIKPFISGELLNFFLLFFQFFATNTFLNYKFELYGWKVVEYYRHSREERNDPELGLRNPMCTVFPTVTSCTIPNVGASGVAQVRVKWIVVLCSLMTSR